MSPFKWTNVTTVDGCSWQMSLRSTGQIVGRVITDALDDGSMAFRAVVWNSETWISIGYFRRWQDAKAAIAKNLGGEIAHQEKLEWSPIVEYTDRPNITAARNCFWKSWLIGRVEQQKGYWDAIVFADRKTVTISATESHNPEPAMHDVEEFIKDIMRITS